MIYSGIDLFFIETTTFDWSSVYDDSGTDYLYDRVEIVGRAVVNGQEAIVKPVNGTPGPFMSYKYKGQESSEPPNFQLFPRVTDIISPTPPVLVNGVPSISGFTGINVSEQSNLRSISFVANAPPLTHATIRHRLSSPRGKLYIFTGMGMETGIPGAGTSSPPVYGPSGKNGEVIITLQSPQAEEDVCDCKNGPIPKILAVHNTIGADQTMMVDWACETYINEDKSNNVRPYGAMLSNRFKQVHMVDSDGYTTIETHGVAIFRTDFVYSLPESPDQLRPLNFMPISQGFRREILYVEGREDVTGVAYGYRDIQVHVNFAAGPYIKAASIATNHRQSVISNTNVIESVISAGERIQRYRADTKFANMREEADKKAKPKTGRKPLVAPSRSSWKPGTKSP